MYGKGFAYRFGGDEYGAIFPNTDRKSVVENLWAFGSNLANLSFEGTPKMISVSTGACEIGPDCSLSNTELLHQVEQAKKSAKDGGRHRIGVFSPSGRTESGIEIIDTAF
jgi:GGDEF domain-containing protein